MLFYSEVEMVAYHGVIGNRDYIKFRGERRPFWEFLDRQPDGWLCSLAYERRDVPIDRRLIWDCGAWSYKDLDLPRLGKHDVTPALASGWIDWLISGGESGYNPRPANLDWFRQARHDCQRFGVSYFHKQNGGSRKIDGAWGGRLLDGREWSEFPIS